MFTGKLILLHKKSKEDNLTKANVFTVNKNV